MKNITTIITKTTTTTTVTTTTITTTTRAMTVSTTTTTPTTTSTSAHDGDDDWQAKTKSGRNKNQKKSFPIGIKHFSTKIETSTMSDSSTASVIFFEKSQMKLLKEVKEMICLFGVLSQEI